MADEEPTGDAGAEIRRATLYCETCGEATPHRILRVDRRGRSAATRGLTGIARCQRCRITRPFASTPEKTAELDAIASDGAASVRHRLRLPHGVVLRVGETVDVGGAPMRLTRLERPNGRAVAEAAVEQLATAWGTREVERHLRLALIEGARSRTVRLPASAVARYEVGAPFRLGGVALVIVALRARGHTWRRPGDAFGPDEVSVVYARRAAMPPAGRSRWSNERGIPSSRTSSSSVRARSRSSPGVRR